jgi:SAM-dependent methyltransferase
MKLLKKLRRRRPPSREETLLGRIDVSSQTGLEIGPLCNPLVTKARSNGQVFYVDWATAEQLRAKFRDDPNVNVSAIVETDFLWGQQTLTELVSGKLFDYVLASHVIEHVPNMIGWLRDVASVLKDDGILSLAIPDKRYTFDLKRELTNCGALIESYLMDRRRPSVRDVFDHRSLVARVDAIKAWNGEINVQDLVPDHSLGEAWKEIQAYQTSDQYVDVHVNVVTPASFLDILDLMSSLGLFDFALVNFLDTQRNTLEFFVVLQRIPRAVSRDTAIARQREGIAAARSQIAKAQ